jgi:hypothetical protein
MTFRGGAALVLAAIGAGAWLAITAGLGMSTPSPVVPDAPAPGTPLDPVIRSVQSQSGRLRAYLSSKPPLAPPLRDPFAFREPPRPRGAARQASAASTAVALLSVLSARPDLTLSGIAEDPSPDGPVRTAIISGMGQLFLVKEGETFGGRFEVVRIGADSVQMRDQKTDVAFTLVLK